MLSDTSDPVALNSCHVRTLLLLFAHGDHRDEVRSTLSVHSTKY